MDEVDPQRGRLAPIVKANKPLRHGHKGNACTEGSKGRDECGSPGVV